jgi:hypothetical protein
LTSSVLVPQLIEILILGQQVLIVQISTFYLSEIFEHLPGQLELSLISQFGNNGILILLQRAFQRVGSIENRKEVSRSFGTFPKLLYDCRLSTRRHKAARKRVGPVDRMQTAAKADLVFEPTSFQNRKSPGQMVMQ